VYTRLLITGLLLWMQPIIAHASTLQEAMDMASKQHPMLQMSQQTIEAARQQLIEQGSYAYNPEVSFTPQRRRLNGGGSSNDYYLSLSQGIEMGGKQGFRQQRARAAFNVATKQRDVTQQALMIQLAKAYVSLYFSRQAFEVRQQQSDMLKKVKQAMLQKMKLGQSSQLNVNLAQSAFASALNASTLAKQAWAQAQQAYALALGQMTWSDRMPELELPLLQVDWAVPQHVYQLALASRPDLQALVSNVSVAEAETQLANAARTSDITLGGMIAREAGDQLISVNITMPFSIWNDHTAAYRASLSDQERVKTSLLWSQKKLRYSVNHAINNHHNAMQALKDVQSNHMQESASNTIRLAQQAYDVGELDLEELVIHIRQGLDAQITTLNIVKQAWMARILLAQVLGHPEFILQGTQL